MSSRAVLLVDSDPAVQEHFHHLLRREDRRILSARDGVEALETLRHQSFDVVVAGQSRNGDDGIRLVRRVRQIQPAARVIVTGDQDPQRVVGAIRQRAYSYVHRPQGEGLPEMVAQALESSSWLDDIRVVSSLPEWITLDIRCKLDAAERTTQFLRELASDLPHHTRDDVIAALRELLMNGIEHGGKSDPRKRVRVSLIRTPKSIIGYIHDPGKGFSLDLLPHAAISNPEGAPTRHVEIRVEEGRRPGGFGILMTRNLVDELRYNERGNSALFVKYL